MPAWIAAGLIAVMLSGCGERPPVQIDVPRGTQTEKPIQVQVQTEAQTEAQSEIKVQRVTEKAVEKETEAVTEAVETETEVRLITSVDYRSKDQSIQITLPDNTWKVIQDADARRVFQSGNAAIISISHEDTPSGMKGLNLVTSSEELEASLLSQ